MADDKKQPIVIKKIVIAAGHHGGAWKVAYADFVTAMMAFFLLLWLLGITDEAQRGGISDVFKSPSPLIGPGGASTSMIKLGGTKELPHGEGDKLNKQSNNEKQNIIIAAEEKITEKLKSKEIKDLDDGGKESTKAEKDMDSDGENAAKEKEKIILDHLFIKLKENIEKSEILTEFKEQLLIEIMPEGLRIQIIDKENRPMFSSGSEKLKPYTRVILHEVAKTIAKHAPNKISITGHTDVSVFGQGIIEYETVDGEVIRKKYSNWELSSDRANAARRELVKGGMPEVQIGRVVGLGSTVLFDKNNPRSPINRRISIIIMKQETVESIIKNEGRVEPKYGISFSAE